MRTLWQGVWMELQRDFADLPDGAQAIALLLRLLMAMILGGLLGYERQRIGKAAGLRTHMLVALAAAFFAVIPQMAGMTSADQSRVFQGVITGIGFIGAGAILKLSEGRQVIGLTTSASIWLATAIGWAVGMRRLCLAILGTVLAYVILALVGKLERHPESPGPGRIIEHDS